MVFEAVAHVHGTFERRHARMALVHSEIAEEHVSRRRTRDAGVDREHVRRRSNFSNAKHSKLGENATRAKKQTARAAATVTYTLSHVSAVTRHPSAAPHTGHRAAAKVGGARSLGSAREKRTLNLKVIRATSFISCELFD